MVDLTKVTIVSQHGENILFQMFTGGARLVGNSLRARTVIQQVERRRNLQYAETNSAGRRHAGLTTEQQRKVEDARHQQGDRPKNPDQ